MLSYSCTTPRVQGSSSTGRVHGCYAYAVHAASFAAGRAPWPCMAGATVARQRTAGSMLVTRGNSLRASRCLASAMAAPSRWPEQPRTAVPVGAVLLQPEVQAVVSQLACFRARHASAAANNSRLIPRCAIKIVSLRPSLRPEIHAAPRQAGWCAWYRRPNLASRLGVSRPAAPQMFRRALSAFQWPQWPP